jgi:hypothetical protein
MSKQTGELSQQIRHLMDSYVKENDMTASELVGVLEEIKYLILKDSHEGDNG